MHNQKIKIYNKSSGMDSLMDLSRGSKTNLSNEVVKLLRSPRTERESEELLAVLRQTIDWTRAAMETGVVRKCLSDPDLVIDLQTNSMFRPIRRAKSVSFCKLFETLNIKNWTADDLLCPESGENQLRQNSLEDIKEDNSNKLLLEAMRLKINQSWPNGGFVLTGMKGHDRQYDDSFTE